MSDTATLERPEAGQDATYFDVIIVGAGISGIGGAYHLQQQCPDKSFVVLEGLEGFGGTWLTHKYPGIRSDSDLYTFGYRFKPWVGPPIASAQEILTYMNEVIDENDIGPRIRYGHEVKAASWSSKDKTWTLEVLDKASGETRKYSCNFLWMCQGYYRHSQGYTPDWQGMDDFRGTIVHPQTWPENLDYKGKKVVIIGSGATAATVAPAIAGDAAHVTVLQRSPTYFIPGRNENDLANILREIEIDETWIHEIVRKKVLFDQEMITRRCLEDTDAITTELLEGVRSLLPEGYDMKHFTPTYRPWRQRIAFVPDGDIFAGIAAGKASMVTDEIDRFTAKGIMLKSGQELEADIIITATGFNLSLLGDIAFSKDGKPVDFSQTVTHRGMMFTGVPNLLWVMGYFRASWTLRADLLGDYVCRLLKHMDGKQARSVTMQIPEADKDMPLGPWLDLDNFNPGYMQRGMHLLPKAGTKRDWQHTQDYWREKEEIPALDLDGPEYVYE